MSQPTISQTMVAQGGASRFDRLFKDAADRGGEGAGGARRNAAWVRENARRP